ncbi:MAG: hypothetical protein ACNYPG_05805 [Candidatus Porifericomitaceae bacterium WSBS_2022_MAG_OTU9]
MSNTFTVSGSVGYSIDGGAGDDALESASVAWDVNGASVKIGNVTYILSNMESFIASGDVANIFTVSGVTTYNIDGGAGADIFTINNGGSVAAIDGGDSDGLDVLSYAGSSSTVEISLSGLTSDTTPGRSGFSGSGMGVTSFAGIEEVQGGTAIDDLIVGISGSLLTEAGYRVGTETLVINGFGMLRDGAGGGITLIGTNADTSWSISGSMVTESVAGTQVRVVQNVAAIQGGMAKDEFEISSDSPVNIRGGAGIDTIIISAGASGNIHGEGGANILSVLDGASISGTVDLGGDSAAIIDFSSYSAPLTTLVDQTMTRFYISRNGAVELIGQTTNLYGASRIRGAAPTLEAVTTSRSGLGFTRNFVPTIDGSSRYTSGTFMVVQIGGSGSYSGDLAINGDAAGAARIDLPDIRDFPGHVVIGGSGGLSYPVSGAGDAMLPLSIPESDLVQTGSSDDSLAIQARRLTIAGDILSGGSVVLLGSSIDLRADVFAGFPASSSAPTNANAELVVVASGGASQQQGAPELPGDGSISSSMAQIGGELKLSGSSAVFVVRNTFTGSADTEVNLGDGTLQLLRGMTEEGVSESVSFSSGSSFNSVDVSEETQTFFTSTIGTTLSSVAVFITVSDPASSLVQSASLDFDESLLQEELTLFSYIGNVISLYLSMCEEVEGCAPPVDLDGIEVLIAEARAKLQGFKDVADGLDGKVSGSLQALIRRYEVAVRNMLRLRQEFLIFFGSSRNLPVLDIDSPFHEVYQPPPSLDGWYLAQY